MPVCSPRGRSFAPAHRIWAEAQAPPWGRHPGHHRPEAHGGEDAKQAFGTSPVKIVGVFEDGREERFPPYGRPRSARSGIPTFTRKSGVKPRPTHEQFMVEYTVRSGDQVVKDALRYMSNSPDFFGLFKILEVICWDLGKGDKEKRYRLIWQRGWVTEDKLKDFSLRRTSYIVIGIKNARKPKWISKTRGLC